MFSNPDQETVVGAAWERFLGGQQPGNILRDPVNSSWQRCLVSNVDPTRRSGPPPVPASSLHLLRQSCSDLLDLSAPVMAHAREFLAETGMLMVLTDPDGTILAVEGDNQTVDDAESIQLIPGVTWSEMVCGTNAIGTALELGQPVQIHSAEHYCEGIKRWTCSATVIRHPLDNEILGVINVSGLSGTFSRHTLGLVVTTASRIESRLTARAMELRYWLLESTIDKLSSNSSDGTILFDPRGHPIKANDVAQTILVRRGGPPDLSRIDRIRALSLDRKDSA
ncbi:MAG: GAF domain-containing protein, partial [Rhodanobacter sp.]